MGLIERKAAWTDVERAIERIAGPHGLMIIFRADQGKIASLSGDEKRCSLYLVGNPVIANQTIISIDLRASFYVPFRSGLYDNGGLTARLSLTIGRPLFSRRLNGQNSKCLAKCWIARLTTGNSL